MKPVWVKVQRVDQSPMSALRWVLTLACDHDFWVTSKSRPTRRQVICLKCSQNEDAKEGE